VYADSNSTICKHWHFVSNLRAKGIRQGNFSISSLLGCFLVPAFCSSVRLKMVMKFFESFGLVYMQIVCSYWKHWLWRARQEGTWVVGLLCSGVMPLSASPSVIEADWWLLHQVSLASDFLYNWNTKEATTTIGYDYLLRQVGLECSYMSIQWCFSWSSSWIYVQVYITSWTSLMCLLISLEMW
jgi:hypothetical protein